MASEGPLPHTEAFLPPRAGKGPDPLNRLAGRGMLSGARPAPNPASAFNRRSTALGSPKELTRRPQDSRTRS